LFCSGKRAKKTKKMNLKQTRELDSYPHPSAFFCRISESFKYHLQAFDYGMPPHAGWAIRLERLKMILTGKRNIREVALYPRDRVRLTPQFFFSQLSF
jgi:elongation factor P--beta-lysine ligase